MLIFHTNSYNKRLTWTFKCFHFLMQHYCLERLSMKEKKVLQGKHVFILPTWSCQSQPWLLIFFFFSAPDPFFCNTKHQSFQLLGIAASLFCSAMNAAPIRAFYIREPLDSHLQCVQQLQAAGTTLIVTPISWWLCRSSHWLKTDLDEESELKKRKKENSISWWSEVLIWKNHRALKLRRN